MDILQLALLGVGLLALLGGTLALAIALWTLRPARAHAAPARPLARGLADPAPTLEPLVSARSASPPRPAPPPEDDEDQIVTTVLRADQYANLEEMLAALDESEPRERR